MTTAKAQLLKPGAEHSDLEFQRHLVYVDGKVNRRLLRLHALLVRAQAELAKLTTMNTDRVILDEWTAAGLPPLEDSDDDSHKTLDLARWVAEDAGGCVWAISMFANQIDGIMIGTRR